MASSMLVPTPAEVSGAWADTRLLLRLRWRMIRQQRGKVAVAFGALLFGAALFATSSLGALVRIFAEQGVDTAAGQYAVNYVVAFERGDLGTLGASALGTSVLAALFSPFTGASNIALSAADTLTGLRPNRLHRYFDACVTTLLSTIGLLQLFTLTTVASLLSLNGGRMGALLFAWAVWPVLLMLSVAEGWVLEWAHRRFGPTIRKAIGWSMAAALVTALWFDPDHGQDLFGIGDAFSGALVRVGSGDLPYAGQAFGTLTVIALFLFMAGLVWCRTALSLPEGAATNRRDTRRWVPLAKNPTVAVMQLLISQAIRTAEIRRPLLAILMLGIPAVWVTKGEQTTITTLVLAVPLAISLSWGVNMFGVLGSSLTWLATHPHLMRRLLVLAFTTQLLLVLIIAVAIWGPLLLGGHLPWATAVAMACGTLVATMATSRSAAAKSVHRPVQVTLGSRGDMIVPPLTGLNYTARFALWGGQFGVLTLNTHPLSLQLLLTAAAVAYCTLRFIRLNRVWNTPPTQAAVIAKVAAA